MGPIVLGWILILIGIFSTVAGIVGGITIMFQDIAREERSFSSKAFPTEFIEALTQLTKALSAAPVWLALTVIGFILIAWGGSLI
ncbi:MAG: hypothetical protein AAFY72_17060 [Cyanobacteria bacterium J06649_4]